ncbi:MAG: hypothetical protein JSW53_00540 [Candidatus Bathyarchaeota archaeon]|nr:MAG: hypothetical protein JSW53_00540 [Candidatus Bathyarchaeota archaeon]
MSEFNCPKCGASLFVDVKRAPAPTMTLEDLKMLFPKDLEELLEFEDSAEHFIVRPVQFLGTQHFAKIATIIRESGGEYISAGRESHFKIPK